MFHHYFLSCNFFKSHQLFQLYFLFMIPSLARVKKTIPFVTDEEVGIVQVSINNLLL